MSLNPEVLSTQNKRGCLVLVGGRRVGLLVLTRPDGKRVFKPIIDVLAPLELSSRQKRAARSFPRVANRTISVPLMSTLT